MLGKQVARCIVMCCCLLSLTTAHAKKQTLSGSPEPTALKQYYESGKYLQDVTHKTTEAKAYLDTQLRYARKGRLAIVLEIDETALSNYPSLENMQFTQNPQALAGAYMRGQALPMAPILSLYDYALSQNMAVFFVSSRPNTPEMLEATVRNLKAAGFNQWQELILMPVESQKLNIADYKTHARRHISSQGYEILVNVGSQEADLIGGYAEIRVKLPNPFYTLS